MNVQQARHSSIAFFLASRRCLEERKVGETQFQMLIIPGIVCSLFSIELGFKTLLMVAGDKTTGHKLVALFEKLGPDVQKHLIQAVSVPEAVFLEKLGEISDAFVQWRYIYEHVHARIDIGFTDQLAHATQRCVDAAVGA